MGYEAARHPVQLYYIILLCIILAVILSIGRQARRKKWAYGACASWFLLLLSASLFFVEYFVDGGIYFFTLSVNQWFMLALFAESIGLVYVRGGGREAARPLFARMKGALYDRIPKRRPHTHPQEVDERKTSD
jgi:prolipoprotein diacylglyceryltransferase